MQKSREKYHFIIVMPLWVYSYGVFMEEGVHPLPAGTRLFWCSLKNWVNFFYVTDEANKVSGILLRKPQLFTVPTTLLT